MSAPFGNQPLPAASPFNPNLRPASSSSGCGKPLLFGCGALLVLFGVAAVVFVLKAPELMPGMVRWTFGKLEAQMNLQLPPDATSADRQRLHAAFASAVDAINASRVTPAQVQAIQSKLVEFSRKEKRTRQDVLEVITALESLAGKTPPAPAIVPGASPPVAPPPLPPTGATSGSPPSANAPIAA